MRNEHEFHATIAAYSAQVQKRLTELRALVLDTAAALPQVGRVEETLKWSQHSFITPETGSGSTIRIDGKRDDADSYALYFHCQSGLIETFKSHYGTTLNFEGNRAIVLNAKLALPKQALAHCISLALTHHLRKKTKK